MPPIEQHAVDTGLLKLRTSQAGATRLIQLEGELDLASAGALEAELDAALDEGGGHVVVDLGELAFIDSTGLALLVTALGRDGDEQRLRFIRSRTPAVSRVLKLTGLDSRLPFVDDAGDVSPSATA